MSGTCRVTVFLGCAEDPWLILHKLDSPSKMRYIGARFAGCKNATDPIVVPASIAEWVSKIGEWIYTSKCLRIVHGLPLCECQVAIEV